MGDETIPTGRFRRFGKLVGMTTRVGAGLAAGSARRLLGKETNTLANETATAIVQTLGSLKGAALKAGQTLSLFSSQLPPEARVIVGKLFSQAPSLPWPEIARVLEEELGALPDQLFAEFATEPFAGASLGQVHRAKLRSGEVVAVKVQYPGIADALEDDLRNLESLLKTIGMGGRLFEVRAYAEEIRRELVHELDYRRELSQLEEYRGFVSRWPDIVVPRAYPELCTGRVLVLELLEGPTLNELSHQAGSLEEAERARRGEQLVRALFGPWILHRAIHADPHPGNYLALPDGRLGVLDFGSVKHATEAMWLCSVSGLDAVVHDKPLDWVGVHERGGFTIEIDREKARRIIEEISRIATWPLARPYDFAEDRILEELSQLKTKYPLDLIRIRPPAEAILVGRALAGLLQNLRALQVRADFRPFFSAALTEALSGVAASS